MVMSEFWRDLFSVLSALVVIGFLVGQPNGGHFFIYLMKLEMAVILMLSGVEDSSGFIFFILVMGVSEGVVGLSILVSLSRSSGVDRLALGSLVSHPKWGSGGL